MAVTERRRINLSVDPDTYARLLGLSREQGFSSVCQMIAALAKIYLDRIDSGDTHRWDIPEDEGAYLDEMFGELADAERTPPGWRRKGPERRHD